MASSEHPAVTLREVKDDNVKAVMDLSVAPDQEGFVAPNTVSLAQAFATTKVWVRAIYAGDEPVGFVMVSDDDDKPRYYLWRFMIDQRHQGKGYGTAAHRAAIARLGPSPIHRLSYKPLLELPNHTGDSN